MSPNRIALVLLLTLLSRPIEAWLDNDKIQVEGNNVACDLYLAPSEIFGRLGVFTARGLDFGSNIDAYDVVIPLIEEDRPIWSTTDWSHLLGYIELEGRTVRAMLAGTGSAVNLHATLHNVHPTMSTKQSDSLGLHRKKDAGVGAFSYQVMEYKVTSSIPPGGQIVLNNISPSDDLKDKDFRRMDRIVHEIHDMFSSIKNDDEEESLDEFLEATIRFIRSGLSHPSADSFPSNFEQFKRALTLGTENSWSSEDLMVSVPWLEEHGVCLDHIEPAGSGTRQAGRGAFAKRSLPRGTVVAPSPVVPVSRFDLMKDSTDDHQLLMNYCFGDPSSSLLLCQYGSPSAYVNHGRGEKTNVVLRWSMTLDSAHETWANMTVPEVLEHPFPGLVLELVATRDIQPGEEIFLDYGPHWEAAWLHHLSSWEPPRGAHNYSSAADWNAEKIKQLRTEAEQEHEPYPSNIHLGMMYHYNPEGSGPISTEETEDGKIRKTFVWTPVGGFGLGAKRRCSILERHETGWGMEETYTVRVTNHPSTRTWDLEHIPPNEIVVLTEVPRKALHFVDTLYSTDHHLSSVFRNEMHVPLDLYPENWLDMQLFDEDFLDEEDVKHESPADAQDEF